ncbi:hypothetical protein [Thaumasiovibrio sp. DFM-14]|uniref:hypothetical protein n=1 Tax=Thaumasiovibrio sp. DFM-14 TaxID=3384792 RepID=UPI0039A2098A
MKLFTFFITAIFSFNSFSHQDSTAAILSAIPAAEHSLDQKEILAVWQITSTEVAPSGQWCQMYISVKFNKDKARLLHKKIIMEKINAGKILLVDLSHRNKLRKKIEIQQINLEKRLNNLDGYFYQFECHENKSLQDLAHMFDLDE